MKLVVSTDMVAHLWANQAQDTARNSRGNFYFIGDTIYSYGNHFPIAKIDVENNVVLFTTLGYSKTTSTHKIIVESSISHKTVFIVPDVLASTKREHEENLNHIKKRIDKTVLLFFRARTNKDLHKNTIIYLTKTYNDYKSIYCKNLPDFHPDMESINAALITAVKKIKEAEKAFIKVIPDIVYKWYNWIDIKKYFDSFDNIATYRKNELLAKHKIGQLLREKDGIIYTSKGAEFPTAHGKLAWKIVKKCHDTKTEFIPNGHTIHVGSFQIDHIDAEGNVKAGCHYVTYTEIELLAKRLGWV